MLSKKPLLYQDHYPFSVAYRNKRKVWCLEPPNPEETWDTFWKIIVILFQKRNHSKIPYLRTPSEGVALFLFLFFFFKLLLLKQYNTQCNMTVLRSQPNVARNESRRRLEKKMVVRKRNKDELGCYPIHTPDTKAPRETNSAEKFKTGCGFANEISSIVCVSIFVILFVLLTFFIDAHE